MAGTMTHALFIEDVYDRLIDKENFKNYKETLKTFSQGHDIFFFSVNILNHKQRKIGNFMHKNNTRDFFKNIVTYIYNNNLEKNYEIMAFLYGYISHYILDSTTHPYITYKSGIFKKNDKSTYKYNSKHNDLETYIDCYMIKMKKNIDSSKFKNYKYCFNTKISKELSNLIDYVFKETYNFNNMSILIKEGILNMKISYRLLRYDPFKIKINIYKFIDKITPKSFKKHYPISYAYNLTDNDYYLNLNHKKWNHPRYKDEIYTYSFIDLYDIALNKTLNIIKNVNDILYNKKSLKTLDKIFLNISMASGKVCTDNTKNKYFEY